MVCLHDTGMYAPLRLSAIAPSFLVPQRSTAAAPAQGCVKDRESTARPKPNRFLPLDPVR
jgi:hypothetical protein